MNKTLIKFDFEHIDVDLYLALKELLTESTASLTTSQRQAFVEEQAKRAMEQFELSRGPLPDWASDWNFKHSLVPGAQLMTKDGRRMGNAHIVKTTVVESPAKVCPSNPYGEVTYYECITDAGSNFTLSAEEINEAFWIGDFLSTPERIIKDFDREGHFVKEPK